MAFQTDKVVTVGNQTAGADGDVVILNILVVIEPQFQATEYCTQMEQKQRKGIIIDRNKANN
jgi:hypothetical protein